MSHRIVFVALLAIGASIVSASPYFYFQVENPPAQVQEAVQAPGQVANAAGEQQGSGQLSQRIHGHINQLYNHGSTAVSGVVNSVQPDLKNIGEDLSAVYKATSSEVGKKIAPLAQTVRPYIDHAQKVVAPYVDQAKQEVPKLINQAGPALSKMSEQVKNVWGRLTGDSNGFQDLGDQVQQTTNNVIEQVPQVMEQQTAQASTTASAAAPKATA